MKCFVVYPIGGNLLLLTFDFRVFVLSFCLMTGLVDETDCEPGWLAIHPQVGVRYSWTGKLESMKPIPHPTLVLVEHLAKKKLYSIYEAIAAGVLGMHHQQQGTIYSSRRFSSLPHQPNHEPCRAQRYKDIVPSCLLAKRVKVTIMVAI